MRRISKRYKVGRSIVQVDFGFEDFGLGIIANFRLGIIEIYLGPLSISAWSQR